MAEWGRALAEGLGAAANTGANIIGDQMTAQRQVEAEQRAADIKLDLAQRMAASEEMMKNRAAERFSSIVKQKAGEEVPLDAAPVAQTGITRDAGKAAGYVDVNGTQVAGSFNADPATLKLMLANAQQRLTDPASTDEQKTQAQELIATLQAQVGAQAGINGKAVEGKTRKRTTDEASQAALDDALQNDAPAFIAGTGMLAMGNKQDLAEKTLAMREKAMTDKNETWKQIADTKAETAKAIADAKLEAAREKAANGQVSASTKTMLITSADANIKASTAEMSMLSRQMDGIFGKDAEEKKKQINARIEELRTDIQEQKQAKNAYMQDLGILKPTGTGTPDPKAATGKGGATVPNPLQAPGKPKNDPLGLFN